MIKKDAKYIKSILQIFLTSILMVSLGACSSEKNQYQKGESVMLDEIFYSQSISANSAGRAKPDRPEINKIVLKYFKLGENKQTVIHRLNQIGFHAEEESNIVYAYVTRPKDEALDLFPKRLNLIFEFDNKNKLLKIKSKYIFDSL